MFLRRLTFLPASFSECEVRTDSTSSTVLLLTLAGQCSDATPRVWRCFTWRTKQIHFIPKVLEKIQGKVLTIRSSLRFWVPFWLRRMLARYLSHTETSSPQCVFRKSWKNEENPAMLVSGRFICSVLTLRCINTANEGEEFQPESGWHCHCAPFEKASPRQHR